MSAYKQLQETQSWDAKIALNAVRHGRPDIFLGKGSSVQTGWIGQTDQTSGLAMVALRGGLSAVHPV